MSFLAKNVNLVLLLLVIGVVVATVGTTIFFQRGLQNRTQAYESTSTDLSSCQNALENYQEKYAKAEREANESKQGIRRYDQLYEEKVSDLAEKSGELAETQKQLNFVTLEKEKFQQYYSSQLTVTAQLNATIRSLEDDIQDWKDKYDDCREELASC